MKKYIVFFKQVALWSLVILSLVVLYYFFYYNQRYEWNSREVGFNWLYTISYFISFFLLLLFLIDFKNYNRIFVIIIVLGTPLWIIIYLVEFFKIEPSFWNWTTIRNVSAILCFSILSPGLSMNFIKYIKNNSNQNTKRRFFRNYHIHEGFVGILFVSCAIFLWIIRSVLISYETMKRELRIFLAFDMVFLYLFLFSGSFLIFRDWRDILKLKFIEKRDNNKNNNTSPVFNPITHSSIKFFKSPRILLYPFGILLNSLSLNLFIHGTYFISEEIFKINQETLVLIGVIFCFISGGMLGIDWYRLFAKIYPNLHYELEQILDELRSQI